MNDEEKKELQELINLLYNGHISQYGERKLEAYIKKQQKEIEELKEEKGYHLGFIDGGIAKRYEMENKIKAKIEEYDDKGMTINLTNRSAGKTFQQAVHYEVKKILQSLLEKE